MSKFIQGRKLARRQPATLPAGKSGGNENRATLKVLKSVKLSMPEVRSALIAINGIKVTELLDGHALSVNSIYKTIDGTRRHPVAMELVANALGLRVAELFPEHKP